MKIFFLLIVSCYSLFTRESAALQICQELESGLSTVRLAVSLPMIEAHGTLHSMHGSVLLDTLHLEKSKVWFSADLSSLSMDSMGYNPMLQSLISALPRKQVDFYSTGLTQVGDRRYTVSGIAKSGNATHKLSFAISLLAVTNSESRVRSEIISGGLQLVPSAGRNDEVRGRVNFDLVFRARGRQISSCGY